LGRAVQEDDVVVPENGEVKVSLELLGPEGDLALVWGFLVGRRKEIDLSRGVGDEDYG